jgi:hypothetical protein
MRQRAQNLERFSMNEKTRMTIAQSQARQIEAPLILRTASETITSYVSRFGHMGAYFAPKILITLREDGALDVQNGNFREMHYGHFARKPKAY